MQCLFDKILIKYPELNEIQQEQIKSTMEYLEKHKIALLFDDLLSQVIFDMSSQPRKAILEALKSYSTQKFFDQSDFEIIFEHFDKFNTKTAKINSIVQGLQIIGVKITEEQLVEKYQTQLQKGYVFQNEYVEILKTEYNNR